MYIERTTAPVTSAQALNYRPTWDPWLLEPGMDTVQCLLSSDRTKGSRFRQSSGQQVLRQARSERLLKLNLVGTGHEFSVAPTEFPI